MKRSSSLLTFGIVLALFVVIQGWILHRVFIAPREFAAKQAVIMGRTLEVRAPFQGTLETLDVAENQNIREGQLLFTITRTYMDPATERWKDETIPIIAHQPGTVTEVNTIRGTFLQGDQKVLTITDTSLDSLYISADIPLAASDVPEIRRFMPAIVKAKFLNDGEPLEATVSAIDPVYDTDEELLTVRLQLDDPPKVVTELPMGLPVDAWILESRRPDNHNAIVSIFRKIFPQSQAHR